MIRDVEGTPVLVESVGPDQCDVCGDFCEAENLTEDGECSQDLFEWDD